MLEFNSVYFSPTLLNLFLSMCNCVHDLEKFAFILVPLIDAVKISKISSRKHLCTKVTPDFCLTYSKNGGNLGSESN